MVSKLDTEQCASEMLIMIRNGPKRIIFTSGELELLHMVSKLDIEQFDNERLIMIRNRRKRIVFANGGF